MSRKSNGSRGRDAFPIASGLFGAAPLTRVSPVDLSIFEDRRTFHPAGPFRPVFAAPKSAAAVRPKQPSPGMRSVGFRFAAPERVVICSRRSTRKEVLFAMRKAGKTGQRKPKRNYWSSISCK